MESAEEHPFRDELISFLQTQPKDISVEDVMYHIYVIQKIRKGQKALKEGMKYSDEEVEAILRKWLN